MTVNQGAVISLTNNVKTPRQTKREMAMGAEMERKRGIREKQ